MAAMKARGASSRAVAAEVGVDQRTVSRRVARLKKPGVQRAPDDRRGVPDRERVGGSAVRRVDATGDDHLDGLHRIRERLEELLHGGRNDEGDRITSARDLAAAAAELRKVLAEITKRESAIATARTRDAAANEGAERVRARLERAAAARAKTAITAPDAAPGEEPKALRVVNG